MSGRDELEQVQCESEGGGCGEGGGVWEGVLGVVLGLEM